MNEPKPIASLSPGLLARKGGAKPAMRSPIQQFQQEASAHRLGVSEYDRMGDDANFAGHEADVVAINPSAQAGRVPDVVRQQESIAARIAGRPNTARPRRSALAEGRNAAFTLRLDADRHLKLRLACTVAGRSAQQLVTEALDRLIAQLPEVASLAAQVKKRH